MEYEIPSELPNFSEPRLLKYTDQYMARKEPDESPTLESLIPEPETCCVTRAPSFQRLGSYLVTAHFFVLSISVVEAGI